MSEDADFAVRVETLNHRFDDLAALKEVSLDLRAGRMAGLIGPDGVGKSTLMSLIAGARRIQKGRVWVLGGDMAKRSHRDRVCPRIAYMPQGLGKNLYMELTVFENLEFFGRLFGQGAVERRARIEDLLKSTGLDPFPDRPAGKLSGGMKQKLGLCCALIHDPDLLILDEPTTGVDPLSRRQFWELIDRIRRERPGLAVLVATAYMDEAERFDDLAAMNAGEILAKGTPAELRARTGAENLEEAFVRLLPAAAGGARAPLAPSPRQRSVEPPAITAKGLTKRFGDFTAVDQVSFEIERGEIFGFLGSNGCGKTTTMKMLTGLLPASEGEAYLFGQKAEAGGLETRRRVGYMSQSFSLYGELTVRQNLDLHARLFHLPPDRVEPRIQELLERFELKEYEKALSGGLPLGVRQRLSLAVAIIHEPEMLILDEPTSGVDPVARDQFWELLLDLSRNRGVTIFISTHFMNEAERCDRISLMHAGRVLDVGEPPALVERHRAASLEDAFIGVLAKAGGVEFETAAPQADAPPPSPEAPKAQTKTEAGSRGAAPGGRFFSLRRALAYAQREAMELMRDPVRLTVALLGTAILMLVFGYGMAFDVENMTYAVIDHDRTPASRSYLEGLSGSRYFAERPPISDYAELDARLRSGDISIALEIPPGFGEALLGGDRPQIAAWIDGSMPFHAETKNGYLQGLHESFLQERFRRSLGEAQGVTPVEIHSRYRFNQGFHSVVAVVPAVTALLLIFIPAVLMALGVVREKELGTITNFYVTPVTRLEFLLGKQLPYVALGLVSFLVMIVMALFIFDLSIRGSFPALIVGAILYLTATTGVGLFVSSFTSTQIAALFGTAIGTIIPSVLFSGMLQPLSSLTGGGAVMGYALPTTYFRQISVGVFTKELGFEGLSGGFIGLLIIIPILTILSMLLLAKQER